ncbi:MAG: alpha-mannosidase [Sphingomonadaceae bacterium]
MFRQQRAPERQWKLILVSHTHWDREWYLPFQRFRALLVQAVDSLLEIMASNPDYRYFTLDGQTIILEDYLEVRPDREPLLRGLVAEGRIQIGPWYVMPDEFLVSAESLVRNLLEGRRVASRFGPVMKIGYMPDPFGHIAQMPQILRGFGIDSAVLWRGVGSELSHTEALWEAPDGSRVLLLHMPKGYANAAVLPTASDALMERLSHIRAELEPAATTPYLLLMNGDDHMFPQREIPEIVREANRRLRDAQLIHGTLPMLIQGVREWAEAEMPNWVTLKGELRSSERAHLLAGVLSSRMHVKQRNDRAQVLLERWAEPFSSFASILAPSPWPSGSTATEVIAPDTQALLRLAWRYLLMNHPHDSICGCSVDHVHREMEVRYDWCEQVAGPIVTSALESLAGAVDTKTLLHPARAKGALVVFNSESGPRTDFVEATVQLPSEAEESALVTSEGQRVPYQVLRERHTTLATATLRRAELLGYLRLAGPGRDWPKWKLQLMEKIVRAALRERMPDLVVTNMDVVPGADPSTVEVDVEAAAGTRHDYAAISAGMRQLTSLVDRGDAQYFRFRVRRRDLVEIGFVAPAVPAHGYSTFHFEVTRLTQAPPVHGHEVVTLENESLSLQVSREDGSIHLIDRETGSIYWGLNSFVDGGDAGDEYTHSPPARDRLVEGPAVPPTVTLEESGPARQRIRVDMVLRLPAGLTDDRQARSEETVDCPVTSWLSLYPDVPRVDVHTVITNRARDHRLRVHFPTRLSTQHSHAEGHFDVIRRPVSITSPAQEWIEHPVTSYPQLTFVDISDGESGLLIANRGLPEYDVALLEGGPCIALTLLRCVGWLSRDDLATRRGAAGPSVATPEAQMIGTHTFDYSIVPHAGGWEQAIRQAHWFARPMRSHWTGRHSGTFGGAGSFVDLSPRSLLLSAVKLAEDGSGDLIIRLYNPTEKPVEGSLSTLFPLASAELSNLGEDPGEDVPLDERALRFPVAAHQIVTLRLTPAR